MYSCHCQNRKAMKLSFFQNFYLLHPPYFRDQEGRIRWVNNKTEESLSPADLREQRCVYNCVGRRRGGGGRRRREQREDVLFLLLADNGAHLSARVMSLLLEECVMLPPRLHPPPPLSLLIYLPLPRALSLLPQPRRWRRNQCPNDPFLSSNR